MLLRDGFGAIYPLAKNSLDGIRDPWWTNLPPIRTMALNVIPALGSAFGSAGTWRGGAVGGVCYDGEEMALRF